MTKELSYVFLLSVLFYSGQLLAQSPGQADLNFNPTDAGYGINDGVYDRPVQHAVLMADGRTVMGGTFIGHDDQSQRYVTRLMQDGSLDTSFDPDDMDGFVEAVAVQPDDKVIIGGRFDEVGGEDRSALARLNADGTLDTTFQIGYGFQSPGSAWVDHIVVQTDGKVICAGAFTLFDSIPVSGFVRLNTNGSLDQTYMIGSGFNNSIKELRLMPNGQLLVAGGFTQYNGTSRQMIARLNMDGTLDPAFTPSFTGGSQAHAMDLRADGKIWMHGNFTHVNGVPRNDLVLLTSAGATDPSFDPVPTDFYVNSIAGQADGKLLVGKHINYPDGLYRDYLFRFNSDGSVDAQFAGDDFNSIVNHVLLLPDQRIMVFGSFTSYGDRGEAGFTRLMPDGTVDPTWVQANALDLASEELLIQPDGKLIIVGSFISYFDRATARVTRIHPNGTIDTTFNAFGKITSRVQDAELMPNGQIVIGGSFVSVADTTYSNYVMRLNSDGSMDTTFRVPFGNAGPCRRLVVQNDGKVVVAMGSGVHRRTANGEIDTTFTWGASSSGITDLLYLNNGDIMVSHHGSTWNGTPVGRVLRLGSGRVDRHRLQHSGQHWHRKC